MQQNGNTIFELLQEMEDDRSKYTSQFKVYNFDGEDGDWYRYVDEDNSPLREFVGVVDFEDFDMDPEEDSEECQKLLEDKKELLKDIQKACKKKDTLDIQFATILPMNLDGKLFNEVDEEKLGSYFTVLQYVPLKSLCSDGNGANGKWVEKALKLTGIEDTEKAAKKLATDLLTVAIKVFKECENADVVYGHLNPTCLLEDQSLKTKIRFDIPSRKRLIMTDEKFRRNTDEYMAPELESKDVPFSSMTDRYALGLIIYQILEEDGKLPFDDGSDESLDRRLKGEESLSMPKYADRRFYYILCKLLANQPEKRYQNIGELAADCDELEGTRIDKRFHESVETRNAEAEKRDSLITLSTYVNNKGKGKVDGILNGNEEKDKKRRKEELRTFVESVIDLLKENPDHNDVDPDHILIDITKKKGDQQGKLNLSLLKSDSSVDSTYRAPEFTNNPLQEVDEQTDIYSIGLMMYQIMNKGKLPFENNRTKGEAVDLRIKGLNSIVPPIMAQSEPEALQYVILKACAYQPKHRYQSLEELREDLLSYGDSDHRVDDIITTKIDPDDIVAQHEQMQNQRREEEEARKAQEERERQEEVVRQAELERLRQAAQESEERATQTEQERRMAQLQQGQQQSSSISGGAIATIILTVVLALVAVGLFIPIIIMMM